MDDDPSGLELDTTRRRRAPPTPRAPVDPAHAFVRHPTPPPTRDDDDDDETDSATGGAFIVIMLFHVVGGLVLAGQAPEGDALATLVITVVTAVFTYVAYYISGLLVHHFGVIALVCFGGWFSLLVGIAAQLVHQLFPWLGWKLMAVITALAFVSAFALDVG